MSLYLNELAPWERKNEYLHHIQLGKDVKSQTLVLKDAINNQTHAQLASASAIIASQDRIREGIDNISYGIDEVIEGLHGLQAAFEFGISEVVWQIEQNRQVLKNILEVLMAPLDTQAKELRRRAEDAYANGWFEEALDDFLESENKNRYDFAVHISIGMIYLFEKVDREKALEYFEKAVKYAKPKSKYHTSFALLHVALIKRAFNLIEEAEKLTAEAVDLTPDFSEALYQNAQYNAQLNRNKSITNLEKAIKLDKNYCIKAEQDDLLNPVRGEVNHLFKRLRDERSRWVNSNYLSIKEKCDFISSIIDSISKDRLIETVDIEKKLSQIKRKLQRLEVLVKRNSYFDLLEANDSFISDLKETQSNLISSIKSKIENEIINYDSKNKSIERDKKSHNDKQLEKMKKALLLGCLYVTPSLLLSYEVINEIGGISHVLLLCVVPLVNLLTLIIGMFSEEMGDNLFLKYIGLSVVYSGLSYAYFKNTMFDNAASSKEIQRNKDIKNKLENYVGQFTR